MASSGAFLRRAMLYVPATSSRMLTKSLGLTCDNITYDLEDSVTPSSKADARQALRKHLVDMNERPPSVSEIAVRINSVRSKFVEADLKLITELPMVDTLVIPKVETRGDLRVVTNALKRHPRPKPLNLIALIESARGVMNIQSICDGPSLKGLVFAAEDFALDLSLTRTPDLTEFLFARSTIVTAARFAKIPSVIDLACTSYKGKQGLAQLEKECRGGKALGFNGKQCIHPSQIETVQRLFSPSKEEIEWAVRVSIADSKAEASGKGAWALDGKMIDAPVAKKAKSLVAMAERCGMDVDELMKKWEDQEPE
ncbi:beta subunit of citrate lyase [Daldinia sp. FL1419]|nr:beta subunit of citrate lyase [Daldinia sp. FL1419]